MTFGARNIDRAPGVFTVKSMYWLEIMEVCYSRKGGINLIAKTCDIESSKLRGESKINLQDDDALKLAHEIIYKITKKNYNEMVTRVEGE